MCYVSGELEFELGWEDVVETREGGTGAIGNGLVVPFEQSCMVEGDCENEGDAHQSQDGSEGLEDCFRVGEDGFHNMTMLVVANGDDVDDGGENVTVGLGLCTLDVKLIGEDVKTADGGCAPACGLVFELVDVQGEMLPWA